MPADAAQDSDVRQADDALDAPDAPDDALDAPDAPEVGADACPDGGCPATIVQLAVGRSHACALGGDGRVTCWGWNMGGRTGLGISANSTAPPTRVPGLENITFLAAGDDHTCAVRRDGTVACWGVNPDDRVGAPTASDPVVAPVTVGRLSGVAQLTLGMAHSCALRRDGTVACWGLNDRRQLGMTATGARSSPMPVDIPELTGVVQLSAGEKYTCARVDDGKIRCWGDNSHGQLGDGTMSDSATPLAVAGITTAVEVTAGDAFACARTGTTTVVCWGENNVGQLGNGTTTRGTTPVVVPSLAASSISAAGDSACALQTDGAVVCWGENDHGQLGDGTTVNRSRPAPVTPALDGAGSLDGGDNTHCALRGDGGAVACWGWNDHGQVGNPTAPAPDCTSVHIVAGLP